MGLLVLLEVADGTGLLAVVKEGAGSECLVTPCHLYSTARGG